MSVNPKTTINYFDTGVSMTKSESYTDEQTVFVLGLNYFGIFY